MKATLRFDLPDDSYEYDLAQRGGKAVDVLRELSNYMRTELKYNSDAHSSDTLATYEEVRTKLYELANEMQISDLL